MTGPKMESISKSSSKSLKFNIDRVIEHSTAKEDTMLLSIPPVFASTDIFDTADILGNAMPLQENVLLRIMRIDRNSIIVSSFLGIKTKIVRILWVLMAQPSPVLRSLSLKHTIVYRNRFQKISAVISYRRSNRAVFQERLCDR